jgi:disulfide bond formation protein DsbB
MVREIERSHQAFHFTSLFVPEVKADVGFREWRGDTMTDDAELLWRFYQEQYVRMRHQESQRESVTKLLVAVAAALLGLVTFDGRITTTDIPLALFLVVLGVFGAVFSIKHYERFRYHLGQARSYHKALDAALKSAGTWELRETARSEHAQKYGLFFEIRTHWLWLAINAVIALLGVVLGCIALA